MHITANHPIANKLNKRCLKPIERSILFMFMVVLCLSYTANLYAQGFNSLNNRNHPYLKWQVAETEHFQIIYPQRIADIEPLAAAIAEETYFALSQNLEVEFEKKIRIYLSDEDEIVNGFANPIGKGYTMIWVNLNEYADTWTGDVKWLRKVVAHELGHIFHFKAVWSDLALLNYLVAEPLPRFWTEGLAQYQTENWDSQRGDRWLRKAIFDSRPNYNDGQSIENGRLMYASGNAQLRYFTETYGDSMLVNLLSHREKMLGFLEFHDFYEAFDSVVTGGYSAFYEDWRKHMNVYYNTLASQMERTDSLDTEQVNLPGSFYFDMALSPDNSQIAVLALTSISRPVQRLYIIDNDSTGKSKIAVEGGINSDVSWSNDGKSVYYSRTVRGEKSALVNDIFRYDLESGKEQRVTYSRRAMYPAEGFEEGFLGYIVNENGTGNLFLLNRESGEETRITNYKEDVQLIDLIWVESQNSWLFQNFDENGRRNMILLNAETGIGKALDHGEQDNRKFVLSPDEKQIAYTSLRDEVPNVFVYDFDSGSETRLTNLFTGGEAYAWMTNRDSTQTEQILIKASETKRRDEVWWVDTKREPYVVENTVPKTYSSWREKHPPNFVPIQVEPDESLVLDRYPYRSFRNITHASTILLPYYSDADNWGLFGTTGWTEPLGKHMIAGSGLLSFGDADQSYGLLSYINNQFYPTVTASIYKTPGSAFFYGDEFLVEELIGGDLGLNIPVDAFEAPYQSGSVFGRLRHVLVRPFDRNRFSDTFLLPSPERARQTDITLGMAIKKQRPWKNNVIHPLGGWGVRALLTAADKILASDVQFATADLSAYKVLPGLGLQRFYVYGRYQQQWGSPLPQNFIGFSRYDNISLILPGEVPLELFSEAERVRGYRSFIAGNKVAFASLEYRIPFLPSLETTVLGIVDFGVTSISLFTDAGFVWDAGFDEGGREDRWGAGAELKNALNLFGINIAHSLGIAQPAQELFTDADYDLYYRVRASVPF
jgi:Tol biopolymer transport system component